MCQKRKKSLEAKKFNGQREALLSTCPLNFFCKSLVDERMQAGLLTWNSHICVFYFKKRFSYCFIWTGLLIRNP